MSGKSDYPMIGHEALVRLSPTIRARDWFGGLISATREGLRRDRQRRYVASLTDRQLRDAGIDLAYAGRGKACAACPDPNLEGMR